MSCTMAHVKRKAFQKITLAHARWHMPVHYVMLSRSEQRYKIAQKLPGRLIHQLLSWFLPELTAMPGNTCTQPVTCGPSDPGKHKDAIVESSVCLFMSESQLSGSLLGIYCILKTKRQMCDRTIPNAWTIGHNSTWLFICLNVLKMNVFITMTSVGKTDWTSQSNQSSNILWLRKKVFRS